MAYRITGLRRLERAEKNNSDVKIMDILGCDGTELPIVDSA